MKFAYDIPDSFWSLFRSMNRELYMEALLKINEEYEYNNYYLSKEVCLQVLEDWNESQRIWLSPEEFESETDASQTPPNRILNWLIKTGWLKRIEDFSTLTTNIIIPDYAAVFLTAFEELVNPSTDDTEIYIQNVYATLFSFWHDKKMNLAMLKTALVNTKKLNKALQDMLHNMDHFFSRLLKQKSYEEVLAEHLEGYVEEIVEKKYHILKTNDNFYLYKNDIKRCLREMREDIPWMEQVQKKADKEKGEDVLSIINAIERGFDDIEHRISNMDKEHSKYIRATVTRMNYMLNGESDTRGLMIQLLKTIGDSKDSEEKIKKVGQSMNLSHFEVLSEKSLYKKRKRRDFASQVEEEKQQEELSREDVLRLNKIHTRYQQAEIEDFIEDYMHDDHMEVKDIDIRDEESFEKLILAYDYSTRRNSKYKVIERDDKLIDNGSYRYPALTFVKSGRLVYNKEFRTIDLHQEFLREYFKISGIELRENLHLGVFYIEGETLIGEKISRLSTIYLLILKLLYDEHMAEASSNTSVYTSLGEIHEKINDFHLMRTLPSITEMRRSIALLKKYQIIEPLDVLEELNEETRMMIYPCVNVVLLGDDIRRLIESFSKEEVDSEFDEDEAAISGIIEDMPE